MCTLHIKLKPASRPIFSFLLGQSPIPDIEVRILGLWIGQVPSWLWIIPLIASCAKCGYVQEVVWKSYALGVGVVFGVSYKSGLPILYRETNIFRFYLTSALKMGQRSPYHNIIELSRAPLVGKAVVHPLVSVVDFHAVGIPIQNNKGPK